MAEAREILHALQSGHDELAALVPTLTAQQLRGPSAASEWDVSQVLSHLGSGAVIGLATLRAALDGGSNPGMEANRAVWARWDAMSPEERAAGFVEADRALLAQYTSLDDETVAALRIDLGWMPQPVDVATAAKMRLNEVALHSWDVRVAFDDTATIHAEAVPLLLDQSLGMLAWLGKPAALDGREVTVAVHLHDPDQRFGLRIADVVTAVGEPAAPDAVLALPAEAWLRLAAGRLGPQHTPAGVEVTGPVDVALLRQVFPGY